MIVSTTLLGRGTAGVVREALRSVVMLVDKCLVIDTGANEEDVAEARVAAGSKYVYRCWPWQDDFAAARNQALMLAAEVGATWALTLDTDERVVCGNTCKLRAELADTSAGALQAPHRRHGYVKPRLIRVPCQGSWRGPNHEGLYGVRTIVTQSLSFWEAPRAPGHLDRKWHRNLATLIPYSALFPAEQRWHYYIAEAHRQLGQHEQALTRYRTCVDLHGWDEEGAWAAYRGAHLLYELGLYDDAVQLATRGMVRHAGIAELPWIAALASARAGRHEQAVYWAALAKVHGEGSDAPLRAIDRRIGFRDAMALGGGPLEVERLAFQAIAR